MENWRTLWIQQANMPLDLSVVVRTFDWFVFFPTRTTNYAPECGSYSQSRDFFFPMRPVTNKKERLGAD